MMFIRRLLIFFIAAGIWVTLTDAPMWADFVFGFLIGLFITFCVGEK